MRLHFPYCWHPSCVPWECTSPSWPWCHTPWSDGLGMLSTASSHSGSSSQTSQSLCGHGCVCMCGKRGGEEEGVYEIVIREKKHKNNVLEHLGNEKIFHTLLRMRTKWNPSRLVHSCLVIVRTLTTQIRGSGFNCQSKLAFHFPAHSLHKTVGNHTQVIMQWCTHVDKARLHLHTSTVPILKGVVY